MNLNTKLSQTTEALWKTLDAYIVVFKLISTVNLNKVYIYPLHCTYLHISALTHNIMHVVTYLCRKRYLNNGSSWRRQLLSSHMIHIQTKTRHYTLTNSSIVIIGCQSWSGSANRITNLQYIVQLQQYRDRNQWIRRYLCKTKKRKTKK